MSKILKEFAGKNVVLRFVHHKELVYLCALDARRTEPGLEDVGST